MTEKELYSFCKKEYNRLYKAKKTYQKTEIDKKDGKDNPAIKLMFFKNCIKAFQGIKKYNNIINGKYTYINSLKKDFLKNLEKVIKNYEEDMSTKEFKELASIFGYSNSSHHTDDYGYSLLFNDKKFIENIDKFPPVDKFDPKVGMYYHYIEARNNIDTKLHFDTSIKENYFPY